MKRILTWRNLAALAGVVVVVVALNIASDADRTAQRAVDEAKVVALKVAKAERIKARDDYKRIIGTCKSSTDLRSLWADVKAIVFPPSIDAQITNPEQLARLRAVRARIDKFTLTNPNCANLPSKPPG